MATADQESLPQNDDFFDDPPKTSTTETGDNDPPISSTPPPGPEISKPEGDSADAPSGEEVIVDNEVTADSQQTTENNEVTTDSQQTTENPNTELEVIASGGEENETEKETVDVGASTSGTAHEGEDTSADKQEANYTETDDHTPADTIQEQNQGTSEFPLVTETDYLTPTPQTDYLDDFSDSHDGQSPTVMPVAADTSISKDSHHSSKNSSKASSPTPPQADNETCQSEPPGSPEQQQQPDQTEKINSQSSVDYRPESPTENAQPTEEESRADSRAEAGQVIPVDPPQTVDNTPSQGEDGRSSGIGVEEQHDGDAFRGEDRSEMLAPDESEDSRGQGQWQSAEQQAAANAMITSKAERETTDELKATRDLLVIDVETLRHQDAMHRHVIKDLQERLAVLARENEEKDKKMHRLDNELRETQARYRETERSLLQLQTQQQAQGEAPKSKTCAIM